jgi:hypothetical protein
VFKLGAFYLTTRGRLVKVFNSFQFADGYTLNAAIYFPDQGWVAVRYKPDGSCNTDPDSNKMILTETFDRYRRYMQFLVWFDRATNLWCGRASDPNGKIIVTLTNIENEERAMGLIQVGVEQKLLAWMREAGYDEEVKESVDA